MNNLVRRQARKEYPCDKCERPITRGTVYAFHHTSNYVASRPVSRMFRCHLECAPVPISTQETIAP